MDSLHAPWRIDYILAPKPPKSDTSLFKRIAESTEDEKHYVLRRERTCFAMLNTYPYTGGHLMVIPYRQVPDLEGLADDELLGLLRLTRKCQRALVRTMRPDGFNIGINLGRAAGAGIEEHLHIHVVPRWQGDTNFMAVLGGTSVLPQALSEVAASLRAALGGEED